LPLKLSAVTPRPAGRSWTASEFRRRSMLFRLTAGALLLIAIWAADPPVEPAPDRNRGLYAVGTQDPQLAGLPFVKGGQVGSRMEDRGAGAGAFRFQRH